MALASKFRKDLSTLQAAVNREIFLDHKHPKLYKKLERFYVSQGLATLTDEDPDYDYNIIIQCAAIVLPYNTWKNKISMPDLNIEYKNIKKYCKLYNINDI